MRILWNILKWLLPIVLLFEVYLYFSGNMHVNKTLMNTVFKGRLGPSIDEYELFPYREVETGTFQAWNYSKKFNKKELSPAEEKYFRDLETIAFFVVKDDSVQYEKYWDGYHQDSYTNAFSAAKSIVSILIGIAIEEGKIKSIDQPIYEFLPEFDTEQGKKITIKHLLTMSSGINFNENYINPFAYPAAHYYSDDVAKVMSQYQPEFEPGVNYVYKGGDTQLLAFVLEKATGMKMTEYAAKKLWIPVGAKNPAIWSIDKEGGYEKASCCFNSNAPDFARLGKLYLDSGRWKGKQLVPEWFVQESIKPNGLLEENGEPCLRYGYQWWTTDYLGAPVFYARGILGQYIIVLPSEKLVLVRLGRNREIGEDELHPKDVMQYIESALRISE